MLDYSLRYSKETDASVLKDFYCGLSIMDDFIHDGRLQAFLDEYACSFYVARDGEDIVGMFVINRGYIELDEDCKEDLEMKFPDIQKIPLIAPYWGTGCFPSIEIDYLAVKKELRESHAHIGRQMIREIMSHWEDAEYDNPLFLSVDAYCTSKYSAVRFYERCNFWKSEFKNPNIDTWRMYAIIDI